MKRIVTIIGFALFSLMITFQYSWATDVPVAFTKLANETGGSPAATAVYRADLTGLSITSIQSLTILDNSFGLGGSPGQFSGFDLDAVKLSDTSVGDALLVNGIAGLAVFDFSPGGTIFAPGTQRAPADPKLFGTGPTGSTIDNAVATLGFFDGDSIAAVPGADGFVSMGDGGKVSFNLTSPVSTILGLFLYIGEVGDNGEVAAGTITVADVPVSTPEPATMLLLGFGLVGAAGLRRRLTK
jgi:hypothetical protein